MSHTAAAPTRLLLATDLSARCDRALDRAAQLAGEWGAELTVLNAVDPAATPTQVLAWAGGASDAQLLAVARQQLARDLAAAGVAARLQLAQGNAPAQLIAASAADWRADLVITGMACNEALGRLLLGSTVEQLARSLSQSLLVVRQRCRAAYQRIVVTTDFSPSSRHALLAAAQAFPGRELILYHAHSRPLAGLAEPPEAGLLQAIEKGEWAEFLAATPLPAGTRVRPCIENGAVENALLQFVHRQEIDLVVMGSHGRSAVMQLLLGSTAAKLLDWLPCDTLLVPDPRARGE